MPPDYAARKIGAISCAIERVGSLGYWLGKALIWNSKMKHEEFGTFCRASVGYVFFREEHLRNTPKLHEVRAHKQNRAPIASCH